MKLKWFKLAVDLFDDDKIKYISSLENGRDAVFIWIKLLCYAAKKNDGGKLYMVESLAPDPKSLAIITGEKEDVFAEAFELFKALDMIRISEDGIPYVKNFSEFQWGDGIDEDGAKDTQDDSYERLEVRKAKDRERKKLARLKSKAKISNDDESKKVQETSADGDKNSSEAADLSAECADLSADASADVAENPFIYIRGEEIREEKNKIDYTLQEERREDKASLRGDGGSTYKYVAMEGACEKTHLPLDNGGETKATRLLPQSLTRQLPPGRSLEDEANLPLVSEPHTPAGISLAEGEYHASKKHITDPEADPYPSSAPSEKAVRGVYKNVFISDTEYSELKSSYPESIERLTDELSVYMRTSGKSYDDHSATLTRWAIRDRKEAEERERDCKRHNSEKELKDTAENYNSNSELKRGGRDRYEPKAAPKERYGDFDPEEAFERAVERSLAEFERKREKSDQHLT